MNTNEYLRRISFLLSMGHPVSIRDIATLTFSSEDDVFKALEQLQQAGGCVWSDGESAMIRGLVYE